MSGKGWSAGGKERDMRRIPGGKRQPEGQHGGAGLHSSRARVRQAQQVGQGGGIECRTGVTVDAAAIGAAFNGARCHCAGCGRYRSRDAGAQEPVGMRNAVKHAQPLREQHGGDQQYRNGLARQVVGRKCEWHQMNGCSVTLASNSKKAGEGFRTGPDMHIALFVKSAISGVE